MGQQPTTRTRSSAAPNSQRRLSSSVRANESQPRVQADINVDAGQQRLVLGVGERDLGQLQQRRRDLLRLDELERDDVVFLRRLELGQLLENLDLGLRLRGTVSVVCARGAERQRGSRWVKTEMNEQRHLSMKACRCWRYCNCASYSRFCCLARSDLVA